jgi:N-carbamoylputrescine amidase
VAREAKVAIIASLFERRAPGLYHNTAVTLNADGAIAGVYRKMHIPDDPLYYEKYYFAPGDLGFQAVDTVFGRVGTLVCWDQWYPEAARLTALQGAEVLFYPTAIGWHPAEKDEFGTAQYDAWQTIQRSHAIANGVYVAGVNRVGVEHGDVLGNRAPGAGLEFWGGSFLADPFGRVIARASHDAEEILLGEIDLGLIEETRRNWPFLRDRRIDAYAGITQCYLDPVKANARDGERKQPCLDRFRPQQRRELSAIACPPSGSGTRPHGWPGRTILTIGRANFRRFLGSMQRSCGCWRRESGFTFWLRMRRRMGARSAFWSGPGRIWTG